MNTLETYNLWLNHPKMDDASRNILKSMSESDIQMAFSKEIEFGTAGMRGIIGPGINRMNSFVVRKATYGFAQYLLKQNDALQRGVVIAHDNRHQSTEFSLESAKVLANLGFKVYLFDGLRPTPELSFAVRELKAIAGIMITASHNPKEYNGYKVYDEHGCQLVPKLADQAIAEIKKVTDYFSISTEHDPSLIQKIGKEMDEVYLKRVDEILINPEINKKFSVTYSPLHGTGSVFVVDYLKRHGYTVYPVESQMTNDPNFGSVASSNPEEGEAYTEAIELAKEKHSLLALVTDPDADRLGVAVLHKGEYVLLNGNQSAVVLLYYILSERKRKALLPSKGIVFSTNVSTQLGKTITEAFGLEYRISLTGFKYIGDQARQIESTNEEYVFGFEESYGCLIKDFVRDKDAVQAVMMLVEAAGYYHEQGKTLCDVLEDIYRMYGYVLEDTISINLVGLEGPERMKKILAYFRSDAMKLKTSKVVKVEDNLSQTSLENGVVTTLTLPKSDMVKFFLDDGSWFVLRPSGTEPKLKVYFGVTAKTSSHAKERLLALKHDVMDQIHQL